MRTTAWLGCVLGLGACVGGGGGGTAGAGGDDSAGGTYIAGSPAALGGSGGHTTAPANGGAGGSTQTPTAQAGKGGSGAAPATANGGSGAANSGSGGMVQAGAASTMAAPSAGARDSHFPLVAGSSWTYHHSGGTKAAWDETDTMTATTYQGKAAFVFEDQEDAQGAQTHSTLVVQGSGVYRAYKEITVGGQVALTVRYDPAFLRYDEAWLNERQEVTLDDAWVQVCNFSSVAKTCGAGAMKTGTTTHVYTVMSTSTKLTVPAGTFDTVQIKRVDPNTAETKLFWFAKGIGKVRDEVPATGEVAELTAYTVP